MQKTFKTIIRKQYKNIQTLLDSYTKNQKTNKSHIKSYRNHIKSFKKHK